MALGWLVAAVGLWRLTAQLAAGVEQVPARFRAVLWLVKAPIVLLATHASGQALLGVDGWHWTLAVATLLLLTGARFELLRWRQGSGQLGVIAG